MNNPTKPGPDQKTQGSPQKSDPKRDTDPGQKVNEKETGERNPYPDNH